MRRQPMRYIILAVFLAGFGVILSGLLLNRYSILLVGDAIALIATFLSYVFD